MPEGPSIVILREALEKFKSKKIINVAGNSKIDQERLLNHQVKDIKNWGKHLLFCFDDFTVKIHLLMFGSYRIDEDRELAPRLSLTFANGYVNFYSCSVKILEGVVDTLYDFTSDVMNDEWDDQQAFERLKNIPETMVCDALMEQKLFSGVGNIIKNETLFIIKLHPESIVSKVLDDKLWEMIKEARNYSFDFLKWRKEFVLKKHYLIYNQKVCSVCQNKVTRKNTGVKNRRSFFCENCQELY